MPYTCVNNTSCNQPKVVPEPEIPTPRGKEWQRGVGYTQAAGSMIKFIYYMERHHFKKCKFQHYDFFFCSAYHLFYDCNPFPRNLVIFPTFYIKHPILVAVASHKIIVNTKLLFSPVTPLFLLIHPKRALCGMKPPIYYYGICKFISL